jgi:L-glyceraldehyde 3-phosphate reductase
MQPTLLIRMLRHGSMHSMIGVTYLPSAQQYDTMQYRRSGRSGLLLPAVSLGLWHNFGDGRPFETQQAIVRRAFDLGVTHFDLANNYGPR